MASTSIDTSPRHDFFQTPTQVIISVYIKGCSEDETQLDLQEDSLTLTVKSKQSLTISPLFAKIDKVNSSLKVLSSKIELSLIKLQPGIQWPTLQGNGNEQPLESTTTIAPTLSGSSSSATPSTSSIAASRNKSKWDSFKDDEEEDGNKVEGPGAEGEANIDAFFKKLYADADDDTKRAMMKSYQESGGTALSTNWEEVRKGEVKTQPPQGMEARKW